MIKIGYFDGNRLHVSQYDPKLHKDKIKCAQGHVLIAKRGDQRQHHFCHKSNEGDDNCSCGMGEWHTWWQSRINPSNIELRFRKDVLKIADAVNIRNGKLNIIEFQKSKMSKEEMRFREKFYTRRDLMSEWGVSDCKSILNWVFQLVQCDIQIDYTFGDIICFSWLKGTKFMCHSKCDGLVRTYYDIGKRDLIQVYRVYKPKVINTKFIGRVIPLSKLDKTLFKGILNPLSESDMRLNCHKILNIKHYTKPKERAKIIDMCSKFYFDKDLSITESDIKSLIGNNQT